MNPQNNFPQVINTHFLPVFSMISQVINKTMVAEAYEKGIEFFIHKPINKLGNILNKKA